MVFRTAQRLTAFPVGGGGLVNVFGNRRGADKAHRLHARVGQEHVNGLFIALHHVEDAVRQAGLFQQLRQRERQRRVFFRRFQHEGIPGRQRNREHPHRHHRREVKRRDPGADAERLHQRVAVDAGPDVRRVFALLQMRNTAGKLHHFQAAGQFAHRVGEDLAVLFADEAGQTFHILFQQRFEAEHHTRALKRRMTRPRRKRLLCGGNRLLRFLCRTHHHLTDLLAGGRVEDRLNALA